MLQEGTKLMVVGMTTVLGFLAFIVIVLNVSARFFDVFGHRWLDADVVSKRSPRRHRFSRVPRSRLRLRLPR